MKTKILSLLFLQACILGALTLEEFDQLETQQQIRVLGNPPDSYKIGADPEKLLRLCMRALTSDSLEVRRIAAQMSAYFIAGIQTEDPSLIPEFKEEYTQELQHKLLTAMESEDPYARMGAAQALAYSSSPNQQIEDLLLNTVRMEPNDEVKISTLTAMSVAGYGSTEISYRALEIFKSTQNSTAQREARKLLGFLQERRLLSELIMIAKGDNPSLAREALLAIRGYEEYGEAIKPQLLEIINSSGLNPEVINLAKVTLDSIETGRRPTPSIRAMTTRSLWPVDLPDQSGASTVSEESYEVIEEVTAPEPAIEEPAEVVVAAPIKEDVEQSPKWRLWLVGMVAVVGGILKVCRKK